DAPTSYFSLEEFLRYCDEAASFYRSLFERLTQTRQGFHLVHYEQINDPWFFAALVAFIGGDPTLARMETGRQKRNPSNIVSRFANPGEVAEFLLARGLGHWEFESVISFDPTGDAH